MPSEPLPTFKYHPDPVATGSVVASDTVCEVCGRARGMIYCGPVFAPEEWHELICPWCIASGEAHEKLDAIFQDDASVPGWQFSGAPKVAQAIADEVCQRTPGFNGWQQEEWFTCCDDAGAYLGSGGEAELAAIDPEAPAALRETLGMGEVAWRRFADRLGKDEGPRAYVFRCPHCRKLGVYHDAP